MILYRKKGNEIHSLYWRRINSSDLYMTVNVFGVTVLQKYGDPIYFFYTWKVVINK